MLWVARYYCLGNWDFPVTCHQVTPYCGYQLQQCQCCIPLYTPIYHHFSKNHTEHNSSRQYSHYNRENSQKTKVWKKQTEAISVNGTPRSPQETLGILIHIYTFPPNQSLTLASWNNGEHPISLTWYLLLRNGEKKFKKQGRTSKTQFAGYGLGR